jgi:hypothetical protein
MSDADGSAASGNLSFERAEFDHQQELALCCGYCKKPLSVEYWQIAKHPACAECRRIVQQELDAGRSLMRFLRALQYGALGAVAGCIGWIAIDKITALLNGGRSVQIGIVAIAVGYLVGKAVRKGAAGQGGTRFQVLAVLLTYSAIALASLPRIIELSPGMHGSVPALITLAYMLPFLGGTQNLIGLFIIGIGLYEAWKLTRALPMQVLGPFPIESGSPAELIPSPDATH